MRVLFVVVAGLVLSLVLAACHEHKPRPVTDCGDNCADAGEAEDDAVDAGNDE